MCGCCKKEKNPVMVEAGRKAWETRRKNAAHAKRVAAAKKAWVTIRYRKSIKTSIENSCK